MSESADIERVQCIGGVVLGEDAGIFKGISSIFSKSAAPAEFCLQRRGETWKNKNTDLLNI